MSRASRPLATLVALWLGVLAPSAGADPQPADPADGFGLRLAAAAIERTRHQVVYDGRYVALEYPGGDVAPDRGVCTDVVIRSYRALGIDLQVLVHESMKAGFDAYPKRWGHTRPDPHIDHRRVPNLRVFFAQQGESFEPSRNPADYAPGDLVTWMLGSDLPHIGIVVDRRTAGGRPLVVHNIGEGPKLEDVLFAYPLSGHYRFRGR